QRLSTPGMSTPIFDARVRLPFDYRPPAAQVKPSSYTERYDEVLGLSDRRQLSLQSLQSEMAGAGITRAVVHAEYEYGDHVDELNEATAKLVSQDDRLEGFGSITLSGASIMRAVRQVTNVAFLGLIGINLQPAFFGIRIDDRFLYPLYAKAAELGLIVALHTGVNYTSNMPMALE